MNKTWILCIALVLMSIPLATAGPDGVLPGPTQRCVGSATSQGDYYYNCLGVHYKDNKIDCIGSYTHSSGGDRCDI